MAELRVTLAAIAGAHGIGGEVRLKLFAESVDSLKRHADIAVGDTAMTMSSVREAGQGVIAKLGGVATRDQAEALRGQLVTVARSALPPLADGEYYHADVIGLPCVDAASEAVGRVVAIEDYGAGELLDVERADGQRAFVPFREPIAILQRERIVVDSAYLV